MSWNGGVTLAEMQTQLQMAGVNVLSGSCGVDGMVYPAFCGGADGKINVFSIPSQMHHKRKPSFTLLTQLPNAQRVQCHRPSPSIPPSMTPQPLSANGQPFVCLILAEIIPRIIRIIKLLAWYKSH